MSRYTKIICTLGPASNSEEMILKMSQRGMNVARINFSHGSHKQHQVMIDKVRYVNEKYDRSISLLQDLEGYRIRISTLNKPHALKKNQIFYMNNEGLEDDELIPFDFDDDIKAIEKGSNIFIEDGLIHLRVMASTGKKLKVKVIQPGVIKSRKGINIPGLKLQNNIFTEKDRKDLEFGIENKFEKIAQSFVRNKKDIQRVTDIVKPILPNCKVIAKIETEEGLRNVESILEACDGLMVARGDLGVSIPIYKLPMVQKYLISHCNQKKKISMTATQMLDSMIDNGRPTRAEVSDVANAILDGSDYVMLSGETAIGRYPSRSIQVMHQIVEYTEKYENVRPH